MKLINLMTKENQEIVITLNKMAQASNSQVVDKSNHLITKGLLKMVEPKNAIQAKFLNENQSFVELTSKGKMLVLNALVNLK
jgi:hypothetical protein